MRLALLVVGAAVLLVAFLVNEQRQEHPVCPC